eukprot:GHVN01031451.1.p1 GENE.GHVN01031451.1~~GHVN01031451.1.p1  ORF type:complete len:704 (+),score=72.99 GHVN01031451.1:281-2392(+)
MEIDFPKQYKDWNAVNPADLLEAPVERNVSAENGDIARCLKNCSKTADTLILWLDCDREGEAIAFEVVEVCLQANRGLRVLRATFSALTREDINRAMNSLAPPKRSLADAVETRQEIDLRIGASFTRLMTLRLRRQYQLPASIVSYGPCQFPTLGFVVERYLQIEEFVTEPFWKLKLIVKKLDPEIGPTGIEFNWKRGRLFDRGATVTLFEMCRQNPRTLITEVTGKEKRKIRPLPMSTVTMTTMASRKLGMASHTTMQVAENLYTKGIISYPRTETDSFTQTIDVKGLVAAHVGHSQWGEYTRKLINSDGFEWPRSGRNNDQAHPPIHPVTCLERDSVPTDGWPLYDMITRHFLACCGEDAVGFETEVEADVAGEEFSTTGLIVLERNYLEVYPFETWTGRRLPQFLVHEQIEDGEVQLAEGRTEPPTLLTEADLIEKMDRHGIGTDATMHEHIRTIQQRDYATRTSDSKFKPENMGIALYKGFKMFTDLGLDLTKPDLRANMEGDIGRVAEGVLQKPAVLRSFIGDMQQIFQAVAANFDFLSVEIGKHFGTLGSSVVGSGSILRESFSRCGRCGRRMDLKREGNTVPVRGGPRGGVNDSHENRFLVCQGYQSGCETLLSLPPRGEITPHNASCAICNFQVVNVLNQQTRRSHTVCPFCFRNPPPLEMRLPNRSGLESSGSGDFRCFMCAHPTCPLAFARGR